MAGDQDPQNRQRYGGRKKKVMKGNDQPSLPPPPRGLPQESMTFNLSNSTSSTMTTKIPPPAVGTKQKENQDARKNTTGEASLSKKVKVGNSVIRVEVKDTVQIPINQLRQFYQTLKTRFEDKK